MTKKLLIHAAILLAAFSFLRAQNLVLGDEVLLSERMDLILGKNIGVVSNTSAVLSTGELFIDALLKRSDIKIGSIFALEHGFDLRSGAGALIDDSYLEQIKVHSVYGSLKKPTPEMLADLDVIIFDVQDIGARFYTYISSMRYFMEACAENNVKFVVLDRPNPLGGKHAEGPVLEDNFKSFIGIDNIPVLHGMTVGELALFFNDRIQKKADLVVVQMKNYDRTKFYDELNIPWSDPSPNIVNFETALLYPLIVFFEGTNISEGRGTYTPFNIIGAPFVDKNELRKLTETEMGKFLEVRPVEFVPVAIEDKTPNPKYENDICQGIQLKIKYRELYQPVRWSVNLIYLVHKLYPDQFEMKPYFDLLWGTDKIRLAIGAGKTPEEIVESWQPKLREFNELRKNYLLY